MSSSASVHVDKQCRQEITVKRLEWSRRECVVTLSLRVPPDIDTTNAAVTILFTPKNIPLMRDDENYKDNMNRYLVNMLITCLLLDYNIFSKGDFFISFLFFHKGLFKIIAPWDSGRKLLNKCITFKLTRVL